MDADLNVIGEAYSIAKFFFALIFQGTYCTDFIELGLQPMLPMDNMIHFGYISAHIYSHTHCAL